MTYRPPPARVRLGLTLRCVLTAAVVGCLGLSTTLAGGVAAATSTAGDAYLRTAHLSPDTPGVDIYLTVAGATKPTIVRNVTYGHFSPYLEIAPGAYSVATRLAGSTSTAKALISWKLTLTAGDAYTAAVLGTGTARRGTVLDNDLTPPAQGSARVRLIQAASNASSVNVVANATFRLRVLLA